MGGIVLREVKHFQGISLIMFTHFISIALQIRKDLPHLKAIVQYKGKLSDTSLENVYEVNEEQYSHAIFFISLNY